MSEHSGRWLASLSLALGLCAVCAPACKDKSSATTSEASARPAAPALPSAASSASTLARARPELVSSASAWKPSPCSAMRVTGSVRTESGSVLVTQSAVNGREWLELGDKAELVLRHGESARELSLHGPGRFLPCRAGLEQVLIASGKLQSSPGTGVRPGAEVWVATPFGALRYADANIEVTVERSSLQVRVRGGQAFTEAADGLSGTPEGRLTGPNGRASARGKPNAEALVSACERAAQAAADSGRQLLGAKPGELGKLAAAQVRSRREARGRCLVASAALALAGQELQARLGDQLGAHERLWQGIPSASGESPQPGR